MTAIGPNSPTTLPPLLYNPNAANSGSGLVGNSATANAGNNFGIAGDDSYFSDGGDSGMGPLSSGAPLPGYGQGGIQGGSCAGVGAAMDALSQSGGSGVLGLIASALGLTDSETGNGLTSSSTSPLFDNPFGSDSGSTLLGGSAYDATSADGPSVFDALESAGSGGDADASALTSILGSGSDAFSSGQQLQPFSLQQLQQLQQY